MENLAPISIKIFVPAEVSTFSGIAEVALSFSTIDASLRTVRSLRDRPYQEGPRSYELVSFRVNSPPVVELLAKPEWLAVLLAVIALGLQIITSYPQTKTGATEIGRDVANLIDRAKEMAPSIVEGVRGLSIHYKSQIYMGIDLYLNDLRNSPVDKLERHLNRARRLARAFRIHRGIYIDAISNRPDNS